MHGLELTVWDLGGGDKIRVLWRHYYEGCSAIIFVLDGADPERWTRSEFLSELDRIFYEPMLTKIYQSYS
eukprot:UN06091